jgi:hypothetical protein
MGIFYMSLLIYITRSKIYFPTRMEKQIMEKKIIRSNQMGNVCMCQNLGVKKIRGAVLNYSPYNKLSTMRLLSCLKK